MNSDFNSLALNTFGLLRAQYANLQGSMDLACLCSNRRWDEVPAPQDLECQGSNSINRELGPDHGPIVPHCSLAFSLCLHSGPASRWQGTHRSIRSFVHAPSLSRVFRILRTFGVLLYFLFCSRYR